jgi:hypothetical protein
VRNFIMKLAPPPKPPCRPMSTPEDIRWAQAEKEAMLQRAKILDIDVELEKTGRG